jgi:hypothetical protein
MGLTKPAPLFLPKGHYCQYTEHGGLLIKDGTWNVKCEHLPVMDYD